MLPWSASLQQHTCSQSRNQKADTRNFQADPYSVSRGSQGSGTARWQIHEHLGSVVSGCQTRQAASLQQHAKPRRHCVPYAFPPAAPGAADSGSEQQPSQLQLRMQQRQQERFRRTASKIRRPDVVSQTTASEQKASQLQQGDQAQRPKPKSAVGSLQQQLQDILRLWQDVPSYATMRIAAAGSTDLLLSFLTSQMHLLVDTSTGGARATAGISSGDNSSHVQLTSRQRRALLRQALVCVSWHCDTHQLLPAEAQRLQDMMLQQLLPALAPHLGRTNRKVLARIVFALGTLAAAIWDEEPDGDSRGSFSAVDPVESPEYEVLQAQQTMQQEGLQHKEMPLQPPQQQEQPQQVQQDDNLPNLPRAAGHLSSEAWVELLLRCLPPQQLTPGALLAAWKGCALHQVRPPEGWLTEASAAMYDALQQNKLDFNDVAALLQACAQLDSSPPNWLMHYLVAKAQQQLPLFNPADLSGVLSSLQALSFRPSNTFLRVWCESGSRLMRGMTISQLAAAVEALSWSGYTPQPWWGRRVIQASLPLLPVATPDELLLLLDGALSLRLRPPVSWVHECYCHLRASRQQLSLSQIADAAHVLAHLQPLPDSLLAHHRTWLAVCLRQQQPEDTAALSRSELLYTLYAVGKLRVWRTERWLSAALEQLHVQLVDAGPAELVATFVVFSYFRKQPQMSGTVQLVWLRDVLAAVCGCVREFSYDGLLQLLLTCADVGLGQQQPAQSQPRHQEQTADGQGGTSFCSSSAGDAVGASADECAAQTPQLHAGVQQQPGELQYSGMPEGDSRQQTQQPGQLGSQQHSTDQEPRQCLDHDIEQSIAALTEAFIARLSGMDLVQLSRVCKSLEAGGGSSRRPLWYQQLLQQCKAALAEKA